MEDINDIEYEISQIDKQIEKSKKEAAEADGSIKTHLKNLKDSFGIKSLEEAADFIKSQSKKAAELEREIDDEFSKLKDKFYG